MPMDLSDENLIMDSLILFSSKYCWAGDDEDDDKVGIKLKKSPTVRSDNHEWYE